MSLQTAQALMHSPRPVEFVEGIEQHLADTKPDVEKPLNCKERIAKLLEELTEVMLSADCSAGQGYLSNAQGNIRAYLALFE